MAKGRVGLDIGSTAVRAAELSTGANPAVLRAAQVPLPVGAVENGEVRQPEAVGEALRELWQRGGFKNRQVWMGVGNQRVVVREIALPYMPEKELRASLGLQVQEFIPMSVEEAVLDFDPLGEFEQEDRKMLRLLLVAAQRVMVDQIVAAVQAAKLEPMGLDLIPFALVRAIGTPDVGMDLEEAGEEAVVDVGAHVTNIVVHARGTTRFVRILPSGGRDITIAIARAAGVEDDVAERLKRGEEVEDMPTPDEVRNVALQRAAAFVDEVRSSLEFYTAQARDARIGRVLLTGGGSKLGGLLDLMRQRIPVPVDPGRVFEQVPSQLSLSEAALQDAEPVLATAIGLAIPGEERVSQVNLLPPEILQGQKTRRAALMVLGAGGVLLALLFAFYLLQTQRLSSVEDDIVAQQQTNGAIQAEIAELQKFEDLQVEAQQQEQLLASAYAGEIAFSGLLMDLSRVVPPDAFLSSLSVTTTPAAPAEGEEVVGATFVGNIALGGEALGVDSVSQFLTRIEQVEGWVNPWASSISQVEAALDSWSYAMTVDLTEDVVTPRGSGAGEDVDG